MARRSMGRRKHAKKFNRARRQTRAINAPTHAPRGGFRF